MFLCQDPFRGREVAVKRIFPEALRDPARGRLFRKLFFTEASLAGKLEHPHIAQIFDAGIGEDSGYIVMEYVPGGTMERFCAPENLLPVEQAVEIVFKCARALAYAHMHGVTHRDIKPGNILYAARADRRAHRRLRPRAQRRRRDHADHRRRLARPTCRPSRSARSWSTTAPTSIRSAW